MEYGICNIIWNIEYEKIVCGLVKMEYEIYNMEYTYIHILLNIEYGAWNLEYKLQLCQMKYEMCNI